MPYSNFALFMHLVRQGGLYSVMKTSTGKLAEALNTSQQTISRKLRDMEAKGYIRRNVSPQGIFVSLSEEGRRFLVDHHAELNNIFSVTRNLEGTLHSGLGEGSYYMGQKEYQEQFKQHFGFVPYPGTLNLTTVVSQKTGFLNTLEEKFIKGFKTKDRTFGPLKAYKVSINGVPGALIFPERTMHTAEVVEIIAPVYLRSHLKLKDGDTVLLAGEGK